MTRFTGLNPSDPAAIAEYQQSEKLASYLQQENSVLHERVRTLEIALAAETERCAKVAEEYGLRVDTTATSDEEDALRLAKVGAACDIAALIRGREREMSRHSVNVIKIEAVNPHANAERLEVVPVGGWQAVVKKGQFKPGDKAVYVQPDYTVPTSRPEFAFLARDGKDRHRLKAVRLRGILSYGLLIPVPDNLACKSVGDDVMADLEIERYEPPVVVAGADELPDDQCPQAYASKFDVESLQNNPGIINDGEQVVVTEKIHGANARYLFENGTFYMGSRTRWLRPDVNHHWRMATDADRRIEAWCRRHEGVVLYGEVYGAVQSLKYGMKPGLVSFAAFAAANKGEWVNTIALLEDAGLPTVPLVYRGPYSAEIVLPLAEQDSGVPTAPKGHMREGVVIVPEIERRDESIGRVALKHISNRYWEGEA